MFAVSCQIENGVRGEDRAVTHCEGDRLLIVVADGAGGAGGGAELSGASVGDSGAWLVGPTTVLDLTGQQNRKPLVGSGEAEPVVFGPTTFRTGRLLVASDGLFKCARRSEIQRRAITGALEDSALALVEAVRLRSGRFQDDVAIVLAETAATVLE